MTQSLDTCLIHSIASFSDDRGSLISLEGGGNVPFDIKRVYCIYGISPGAERGFHAHRDLRQMAVCLHGSCTIVLDNGRERREVRLDMPDQALEIGNMVWREMRDFSADCVLMVLASQHYDEADYIRDYPTFQALAGEAQ
jgi:dTDP-4-dehydrorhamnose 3,5-epimerase-like enzyme